MQSGRIRATANITWLNYWTSSVQFSRDLATTSVSLTRGGPLMGRGPGWTTNISVGNRATLAHAHERQRLLSAPTTMARRRKRVSGSFSMRPGPRWQFSVSPFYDRVTEPQQYISTLPGGGPRPTTSATSSRSSIAARCR